MAPVGGHARGALVEVPLDRRRSEDGPEAGSAIAPRPAGRPEAPRGGGSRGVVGAEARRRERGETGAETAPRPISPPAAGSCRRRRVTETYRARKVARSLRGRCRMRKRLATGSAADSASALRRPVGTSEGRRTQPEKSPAQEGLCDLLAASTPLPGRHDVAGVRRRTRQLGVPRATSPSRRTDDSAGAGH